MGPALVPWPAQILFYSTYSCKHLTWGQQHECCMQDFPTVEPGSAGHVGVEVMPENYNLLTCDGPPYAMDPVDQELTAVTCGKSAQNSACREGGKGLWWRLPVSCGCFPRYASGGGQRCKLVCCPPGLLVFAESDMEECCGGASPFPVGIGLTADSFASAADWALQGGAASRADTWQLQVSHTWNVLAGFKLQCILICGS